MLPPIASLWQVEELHHSKQGSWPTVLGLLSFKKIKQLLYRTVSAVNKITSPDCLELEGFAFWKTENIATIQFPPDWEHRLFSAHDRSSNQVTIGVLHKNHIKRLFLDDVMFIEFQQTITVLEITGITGVKFLDATKLQQLFHCLPTRPLLCSIVILTAWLCTAKAQANVAESINRWGMRCVHPWCIITCYQCVSQAKRSSWPMINSYNFQEPWNLTSFGVTPALSILHFNI